MKITNLHIVEHVKTVSKNCFCLPVFINTNFNKNPFKAGIKKSIVFISFFILAFSTICNATTYYSRQTGNWDANTSWNTDVLGAGGTQAGAGLWPGSAAGDIAVIGDNGAGGVITISYPTNTANSIASITIQDDAILDFGTNSKTLATTGDFTMDGTASITGGAASRVLNVGGQFIILSTATAIDVGAIALTVTDHCCSIFWRKLSICDLSFVNSTIIICKGFCL